MKIGKISEDRWLPFVKDNGNLTEEWSKKSPVELPQSNCQLKIWLLKFH